MSTEKKLTAMQEAIQELKDCLKLSENDFITQSIKLTIHICETKLEKEKQQIIDGIVQYEIKHRKIFSEQGILNIVNNAEQYYEETFKKD